MQVTTEICDFKLLLVMPRKPSKRAPKSQIHMLFAVVFVHFLTPRKHGEVTKVHKKHGEHDVYLRFGVPA